MRARAPLLGGLGVLATLVAVAVLLDPGLADALPGIGDLLESQDSETLLLALGAVVATYAAWTARAGSSDRQPTEGPSARFARVGDPPEVATAADRTRTGESFDARVEAACAGDDEALQAVRTTLAEAATSARERTDDPSSLEPQSSIEPRQAVRTGAWTDDDLAAAFLAGEEGPGFPLLARLRAWLDSEAERRRRIKRTVEMVQQSMSRDEVGSARAMSDPRATGSARTTAESDTTNSSEEADR